MRALPTRWWRPGVLDATKCVSYLTIEYRGAIRDEHREGIGNHLFGCDVCQEVCPWNAAAPHANDAWPSRPGLSVLKMAELAESSDEELTEMITGTPLMRAGVKSLRRNLEISFLIARSHQSNFLPWNLRNNLSNVTDLKEDLAGLRIERDRGRPRSRRWVGWVVLLILLAAAGAGGWMWVTRERIIEVQAAEVSERAAGTQAAVLNASGYVTARRRATVSSKITGKVIEVNVEEGMIVTQGQVLARLDDSTPKATLALAMAQAESARKAVRENEVHLVQAETDAGSAWRSFAGAASRRRPISMRPPRTSTGPRRASPPRASR